MLAAAGVGVAISLSTGCRRAPSHLLQGYIEGEFVYVASPLAGALEKLHTQRGTNVKAGEPLSVLESEAEKAARDEAERRLVEARATLEDVKKGKRPSELASLEAQFKQAKAALEYSERELSRLQKLFTSGGVTTEQEVDRARSTLDQDRQRAASLDADLTTARLGARSDQITAAEANVKALEAALTKAEWDLTQKRQNAPEAGIVFDTLYREGEWVAAGHPVVAVLPPRYVKLRVFVPEPRLGSLHLGDPVQVFVDGVSGAMTGKISFISPRAEYTPPVVYSQESRAKFVFLVEATFEPAVAAQLHPGQPVDVQLNAR